MIALGQPWGLLGLLAVPAILLIHLFRRRARQVVVSGLFLFEEAREARTAGRKRAPLVRRASLIAELLMALVLTFMLADPYLSEDQREAHVVVVIDTRATLAAVDAQGRSAVDKLREDLRDRLAGFGRAARVTLVASGRSPRVLSKVAAPMAETLNQLDQALASADSAWHPIGPAIELARDLAGETGHVLLASDRAPEGLGEDIGLVLRGEKAVNAGFTGGWWYAGNWAVGASKGRVVVRAMLATGDEPVEREIRMQPGDHRRTVVLQPGIPQLVVFEGVSSNVGPHVTLELTGQDGLDADDHITLIAPPRRRVRTQVVYQGPGRAGIQRALEATGDVDWARNPAEVDLWVAGAADKVAARPGAWVLRIQAGQGEPTGGPYLAARGHWLLREVDLVGVVWAGGRPIEGASDTAQVLLAGGTSALVTEPLATPGRLILHVDLARTELAQHPAWPGLWANLVSARRVALPGPNSVNLPAGATPAVAVPLGFDTLTLAGADGHSVDLPVVGHAAQLPPLNVPGRYMLRLGGEDWGQINALRVDPRLSDLNLATTANRDSQGGISEVSRRRGTVGHLLPILLGAGLALLAWLFFRREQAAGKATEAADAGAA